MTVAVGLPVPSPARVLDRFTPSDPDDMVAAIDRAITEGSLDPQVRAIADQLASDHDWRDQSGAAVVFLRWVQSRIRYAEDPDRADLVQLPTYTLAHRSGDCVAQTVLLGSLLRARGIKASPVYVDPDGLGIAHVLLRVEPSDAQPFVVDPIDYSAPLGYVPRGSLFISHGDGRAVPIEGSTMLATTARRSVGKWGRGYGYLRAVGANNGNGDAADDEVEKEVEDAGPDYFKLGLGGALGALSAGLLGQAPPGTKPSIDPKTGGVIYTPSKTPAPGAPAPSTVFGMPLFVTVGVVALILWALTRRRGRRRAA